MSNVVEKAYELLDDTAKNPAMYAANRESFVNRICTIVGMTLPLDVKMDGVKFYAKHLGTKGNMCVGGALPVEHKWAIGVINDARRMIENWSF